MVKYSETSSSFTALTSFINIKILIDLKYFIDPIGKLLLRSVVLLQVLLLGGSVSCPRKLSVMIGLMIYLPVFSFFTHYVVSVLQLLPFCSAHLCPALLHFLLPSSHSQTYFPSCNQQMLLNLLLMLSLCKIVPSHDPCHISCSCPSKSRTIPLCAPAHGFNSATKLWMF